VTGCSKALSINNGHTSKDAITLLPNDPRSQPDKGWSW
jgi:hypothetical protein